MVDVNFLAVDDGFFFFTSSSWWGEHLHFRILITPPILNYQTTARLSSCSWWKFATWHLFHKKFVKPAHLTWFVPRCTAQWPTKYKKGLCNCLSIQNLILGILDVIITPFHSNPRSERSKKWTLHFFCPLYQCSAISFFVGWLIKNFPFPQRLP